MRQRDNERSATGSSQESGFTIIEVLVSLALFLIITGAIFGVMQVAQQGRAAVNEQVPLNKNARVALNLLGRDALNVGFGYPLRNTVVLPELRVSTLLGIPADNDADRDTIPPIISGNNRTENTFNTTAGVFTDQVTFLFKDTTFNLVPYNGNTISAPLNISAPTTVDGIDEIIPISGGTIIDCRVNDIFLVTGNTGSALGVATGRDTATQTVQFANLDILNFNLTGAAGPLADITTPASMQRVRMVTYHVTPDGTLMRREYANSASTDPFVDDPLVFGVEDFQIQYVMDDGTISNDPTAGPDEVAGTPDDEQANLAAIRQIRFTIKVRTTESSATGLFNRVTMTSTFGTRNLGYDPS